MDSKQLQTLLTESFRHVCRKELNWKKHVRMQGLMCVTVDESDVLVVQIDEQILENFPSDRICASTTTDGNVKIAMPNLCLTRLSTAQLKSMRVANSPTLTAKSSESEQFDESTRELPSQGNGFQTDVVVLGACADKQQTVSCGSSCVSGPMISTLTGVSDESQRVEIKTEPIDEWSFDMSVPQGNVSTVPYDANMAYCQKREETDAGDCTAEFYREVLAASETEASSSNMHSDVPCNGLFPNHDEIYGLYHSHSTDVDANNVIALQPADDYRLMSCKRDRPSASRYSCGLCSLQCNRPSGLYRHRVEKHGPTTKTSGRGRRRKQVEVGNDNASRQQVPPSAAATVVAFKRKRGRPRKNPFAFDGSRSADAEAASEVRCSDAHRDSYNPSTSPATEHRAMLRDAASPEAVKAERSSMDGTAAWNNDDALTSVLGTISGADYWDDTGFRQRRAKAIATRRFRCRCCNKSFRFRFSLMRHAKEKHGLQPVATRRCWRYACSLCNKKFRVFLELERHRSLLHATAQGRRRGRPPKNAAVELTLVGKRKKASYLSSLRRRLALSKGAGDASFTCTLCNRQYHYRSSLAYHQFHKHGLERKPGRRGRPPKASQLAVLTSAGDYR